MDLCEAASGAVAAHELQYAVDDPKDASNPCCLATACLHTRFFLPLLM